LPLLDPTISSRHIRFRPFLKGIGILMIFLFFIALGGVALILKGDLWLNRPSLRRYPIQGLDVSAHQGEIDWPQVAKGPWSFVYIKASEGGDFRDPRFALNWQGSREVGLLRGAYHFFTFCRSGSEQAQNFISLLPSEPDLLPPVVDLEFGGNCKKRPSQQALVKEVQIFLDQVEKHTHQKPLLYVTDTFAKTYLKQNAFSDYSLWVRDILREPVLFNQRVWLFWQFSNRGRVAGIQGFVDQNVFAGSPAEFRRWYRPQSQ